MKVLVFVPRHDVQQRLQRALSSAEFIVETVESVRECMQVSRLEQYDAVLADSDSLFFENVLILVKFIRCVRASVVLLVLARHYELEQRLRLFEAGTDDCIREPFYVSELAVRLKLLIQLRKAASKPRGPPCLLRCGELQLDLISRTASRSDRIIALRPKEFVLLEYLVRNANRPVTRAMLVQDVWNSVSPSSTNLIEVYISALRSKIDHGFGVKLIRTTRGMGYTLLCDENDIQSTVAKGIQA